MIAVSFALLISSTTSTAVPPSPGDVREALSIARSLLNGLSIDVRYTGVGYVGDLDDTRFLPKEAYTQTTTERSRTIHTWANGRKRLERWSFGTNPPNEGPFRHGIAYFDGSDTFLFLQRSERDTQPGLPVLVENGLNERAFPLHPLANYESLVFGGLHPQGLGALLADPSWTIVIQPTAERVHGHDCWKIALRKEGSTATLTYWLGQDVGLTPVMSTVVADRHPVSGQPGLINGTIASNFEEVRPGLWLPGVVRITDPYDPQPETYHHYIRESVRILDEGEDLCPELASGLLDMIDFRTGERYLLLDGERGPSTPLTDAKKIDRSLDELFAHGRVLAAKAPAPKSTGSATLLVIATSSSLALAACWWCLRIFRK